MFVTYGYCTKKLKLVALRRAVGLIANKQSPPKVTLVVSSHWPFPHLKIRKPNRRLKLFMRKRMVMLERCGVVAFRVPLIEKSKDFTSHSPRGDENGAMYVGTTVGNF